MGLINKKSNYLKAEILVWKDIRDKVHKVNPEFADIVDSLDLKEEMEFCKVDYPFGAPLYDQGKLFLPCENNKVVSVDNIDMAKPFQRFFDRDTLPFFMLLDKSISHSFEEKKQFVPIDLFSPGQFFGLWELFDCGYTLFDCNQLGLYSGARCLFCTNKISNSKKYQMVKRRFNLKSKLPKNLKDHYCLFSELANHPEFLCKWKSSVLFFSKRTKERLISKNVTCPLQVYFLKYIWRQTMPWRFEGVMRLLWNQVSILLKREHFKNFGYQLSVLKHLIKVSLGVLPCFVADDPGEITAPIDLIKEVLIDEYGVEFCPTIMVPWHLSHDKDSLGYFSINESIPMEEAYINKTKKTTIEMMRGICEVYEFINENAFKNMDNNAVVDFLIKGVRLDFFHSLFDQKDLLLMSSALPERDPSLVRLPKKYGKSILPFNENGSFFRGLIRININKSSL